MTAEEQPVLKALEHPRWDFRTLEGISNETGFPQAKVKEILDRYPELVRKSVVPDRRGRELYTKTSRRIKGQEMLAMVRAIVSKSAR
jgi:hypothetical protein